MADKEKSTLPVQDFPASTGEEGAELDTPLQILLGRKDTAKAFEEKERDQWQKVIDAIELTRSIVVGGKTKSGKIKYPLVYGAYDNYLSSLSSSPGQVLISSDDADDFAKTLYWRGILDHTKRVYIKMEDIKTEFLQSFLVSGKAVYKVGRKTRVEEAEDSVDHKTAGGKTLTATRKIESVTVNQSFADVIDPRRVWLSPETRYKGPLLGDECPYIIEEMIQDPDHIENRYDVKLKDDELESISINESSDDGTKEQSQSESDDIKRVRVYSYQGMWDFDRMKKGDDGNTTEEVVTDDEDNVIRDSKLAEVLFTSQRILKERPLPYKHQKKTYIYVLNIRKFFKAKAMGALDAVMDLDQEYNEHMNRIRTYVRRMVTPKWAKLTGTKIDEAALLNPDVGVVVEESKPGSFRAVVNPTIDAKIFEKATKTEQLFQFITAINYGETALKDVGTATGQQIAERGAGVKIARMVRLLERGQEELEIMLLQLEQQYGSTKGTSIKILGADVVKMIKDKKKVFRLKQEQFAKQNQNVQGLGAEGGQGGAESLPPQFLPPQPGQVTEPMDEPIDNYENFKVSEDGKTVHTKYTREEIQGEFELNIISQSSNMNDRIARSGQLLKAIETGGATGALNLPEAWRLWFQLQGESDTDRLIAEQQPNQQPAGALPNPGIGAVNPTNDSVGAAARESANQVV